MSFAGMALLTMMALAQTTPAVVPADAAAGQVLFEGNGRCLTCHRVNDGGSGTARELSWIGLLRTPDKLRTSLLNPKFHSTASAFTPAEIGQLVSYLRTLRNLWKVEAGGRDRDIPPPTLNAPFFDRPDRDKDERPDVLVAALEIRRGATVADVGSGTGYFTWRLAQQVGPTGRVYAVDIQQSMLDRTRATVEAHKLTNVQYRLATEFDPGLPPRSVDFVFIAYTFHEFADPEATLQAIRRALKPGGRVLVLEYAKESTIAPASPAHKMSFEEIRREVEPLGFVVDQLLDFLPVQHGVIFTIK